MAEEKRPKKRVFGIWPNMEMAETPLARTRFSPLALDSANLTV
jgi:hypothetical protein